MRPPGLAGSLDRNDRSGQELDSLSLACVHVWHEAFWPLGLLHMGMADRGRRSRLDRFDRS
jgi:hypothetical protein